MLTVSSHLQASMLESWEGLCSWAEYLEGNEKLGVGGWGGGGGA